MATRREIEDFIREDEAEFREEREPLCTCDNCGDPIYPEDDMAVMEEHICTGRPSIRHICAGCWEGNRWNEAGELLDLAGIWYWSGDAVEAMRIAGDKLLEGQRRYKALIGSAVSLGLASVGKGAAT